jgi:hypothetical protein
LGEAELRALASSIEPHGEMGTRTATAYLLVQCTPNERHMNAAMKCVQRLPNLNRPWNALSTLPCFYNALRCSFSFFLTR